MSGLYFSKKTDLKPKVRVFDLDIKNTQTQESSVTLYQMTTEVGVAHSCAKWNVTLPLWQGANPLGVWGTR